MDLTDAESAFVLFDPDGSVRSVLSYGEFDAILFRAANLAHFADVSVKAAFVQVDPALKVVGAVFFRLNMDGEGYVTQFTLPLERLIEQAAASAFARPVVVSRDQCPDPTHVPALWQPTSAVVHALMDVVEENELGLHRSKHLAIEPAEDAKPVATEPPTPSLTLEGLLSELERARAEIRQLRSALRHEQDRNRRLQDSFLNKR